VAHGVSTSRLVWALAVGLTIAAVSTSTVGIEERFEEATRAVLGPGFAQRMAERTHLGAPPCRRWVDPAAISKTELQGAARAVLETGSVEPLLLVALTHRWSLESEAKAHGEPAAAEVRREVLGQLSSIDRFWFRTVGRRHLEAFASTSSTAETAVLRAAERAEVTEPKTWLEATRATWAAYPLATSDAGWPRLIEVLTSSTSRARSRP